MRIPVPPARRAAVLLTAALPGALAACGRGGANAPGSAPSPRGRSGALTPDPIAIYAQAGLVAGGPPVSFVGAVRYLAARTPDSTLALLTLSLPNSSLTFVRDAERYRATYAVTLDLKDLGRAMRSFEVRDVVRVPAFRETTRTEESVIFQQYVTLAPGEHRVTLSVRDEEGTRSGGRDVVLTVPRISEGSLSSPVVVYEATPRHSVDSLPHLVPSPRATVVFGHDSALALYVEAYGGGPAASRPARTPLRLAVSDGTSRATVFSDSASLPDLGRLYAGVVLLPVPRMGVGLLTVSAWRPGARDTVTTPVFVTFGENLPVASFEDMLSYLRYYTTPERLRSLRDTAPEYRAAAWADFLRQTDPVLSTPEHEGLRDYFARLQRANERFREEGIPGWQTERGAVFITLGEPDQIFDQQRPDQSQRGRVQVWEYSQYRAQLVFVDQSGFGRWRLTAGSQSVFQSIARRVRKS